MTGTGQDPLTRLADELGHLGRRLEAVGQELHRVGSAQAVTTSTAPLGTGTAAAPTSGTPVTSAPVTNAPVTSAPVTGAPASEPTAPAPLQTEPAQTAHAPAQTAHAPAQPAAPTYPTAPRPPAHPNGPAAYPAPQPGYAPPPQGPLQGPPQGWGQPAPYWPPTPPPPPGPTLFDRLAKDGAGSKLLAWVGGAVTLLGVVLLLVLAVQRGYLGPLPRVLGGAALGGVLVGLGLWLHRTPAGRTGAFALAATGIAVLYLDVIAATSIYDYLPEGGGLAAGLLIAGGGLLLALRWDSAALAIGVVAACAVCAPVLTQGFTPLLVAFLLVLKIAASPVHLKRDWPWLAVTAGVPPLIASVLVIGRTDEYALAGISLLAAVIGVAAAVLTINARPADTTALALAVGSPLPALLTTAVLDRTLGAGVAGAVAVLMLALWAAGRRSLPKNFTAAVGAVGVFALFQATTIALDGGTRAAVVLAEALALAFLAKVLASRGPLLGSLVFGAIGFLLTVAHAVPPRLLLDEPWRVDSSGFLVSGMLTALVLGVLVVVLPWVASGLGILGRHPFPWIVTGVVLLYAAAGVVLCGALLVSQDVTGFLFGHSIVTVSWTVAALVLLVRGIDRKSLRVAGLVLVGAAVAKLLLFDMAALDGIARVLAFIGAGLVLLTAGTRYAKLVATRRISADS